MYKLVLIRHGESTWNLENRFTGWTDVGLSEKGVTEAREAGHLLRAEGFTFDEQARRIESFLRQLIDACL